MAKFLAQLRGDASGIKDLVSTNNWIIKNATVADGGIYGGKAISFPGISGQKIYKADNILYGLDKFTVSCWVKWMNPISTRTCCNIIDIEPTLSTTVQSQRYPDFIISSAYRTSSWRTATFGKDDNNIVTAGSNNASNAELLNVWVHHVVTCDRSKNELKYYVNGKLYGAIGNATKAIVDNFFSTKALYTRIGSSPWVNEGADYAALMLIDDYCITDNVMWKDEFTPPTTYLTLPDYVYIKDDSAYGVKTSALEKLTDNWSQLNSVDKLNIFNSTNHQEASINDLIALNKFKTATHYAPDYPPKDTRVYAVPSRQFINELNDIDLKGISYLDWIKINNGITGYQSGAGNIKALISRDYGLTWMSYDSTNQIWNTVIDTTNVNDGSYLNKRFIPTEAGMDKIKNNAMTIDTFNSAPWNDFTLAAGYKTLRVGYYIEIAATYDTALSDSLTYQYDGIGDWMIATANIHYTVKTKNSSHTITWMTNIDGKRVKINY